MEVVEKEREPHRQSPYLTAQTPFSAAFSVSGGSVGDSVNIVVVCSIDGKTAVGQSFLK